MTHQLEQARQADIIVVLHEGRVVEQGSHEILLARDGVYADMWRHQHRANVGDDGRVDPGGLADIPLFAHMGPEARASLAEAFEVVQVPAGDALIRQGDVGHHLYVLARGSVSVRSEAAGHLATLDQGDFFGELALVDRAPRTATVTATTWVTALRLRREDLQVVLAREPQVLAHLLDVARSRRASPLARAG